MPCFRLSIQSWVYRSFNRYLYSIPIFLFSFASLSRLSFSAFSLSLSSIPSFLWLALRIDSPKSIWSLFGSSLHRSGGSLRGDGKVGESWLWTERKKAVVFRWNIFLVSVFFPSLLVKARRQVSLLGISFSPERIEMLSRHALGIDHLPNYMVLPLHGGWKKMRKCPLEKESPLSHCLIAS